MAAIERWSSELPVPFLASVEQSLSDMEDLKPLPINCYYVDLWSYPGSGSYQLQQIPFECSYSEILCVANKETQ